MKVMNAKKLNCNLSGGFLLSQHPEIHKSMIYHWVEWGKIIVVLFLDNDDRKRTRSFFTLAYLRSRLTFSVLKNKMCVTISNSLSEMLYDSLSRLSTP